MKNLIMFVLSVCLSTVGCTQDAKQNTTVDELLGTWIVKIPSTQYQGVTEYTILKSDNQKYTLFVNKALEISDLEVSGDLSIHYQIKGIGPDGPEEMIQFRNGKLTSYYLENGKWIKVADFYKSSILR